MGFAGLLVMGIGYRIVPRFRGAADISHRIVLLSYALVVAGLVLRTAQLLDAPATLLVVSGTLELAGALIYAVAIIRTLGEGDNLHHADELLIATSAAWYPVAAMWGLVALEPLAHGAASTLGVANAASVAALLIGFVAGHILAVSVRIAPAFIAARPAPNGIVVAATAAWAIGTLLVVAGASSGAFVLLAAASAFVVAIGPFRQSIAVHAVSPSALVTRLAFRGAYGWLLVGLALVALDAATTDGSHPLVTAGRHALALGFLVQLAYGVGARLVPALTGATALAAGTVRWAIVLINVAAALRVGLEIVGPSTTLASIGLVASAPLGLASVLIFGAAAARSIRRAAWGFA